MRNLGKCRLCNKRAVGTLGDSIWGDKMCFCRDHIEEWSDVYDKSGLRNMQVKPEWSDKWNEVFEKWAKVSERIVFT